MQAEFLARKGHHITFVTTQSDKFQLTDHFNNFIHNNPNIDIVYINIDKSLEYIYEDEPGANRYRWNNESIHVARKALPVIQSIESDVYIAHHVLDALALPIGRNNVVHLHGYPEEMNYAYELTLSYAYKYVAVSKLVKERWLSMIDLKDVHVVYNWIDTSKFFYKPQSKSLDLLYVGRLLEVKWVQYLIKALHILHNTYKLELNLCIAGIWPYADELKSLVSEYNLTKHVKFAWYIADQDLPGLYTSAKLAVLPSSSREGVLTTMLESSACWTVVLTSEWTSMVEFIGNEENGFLSEISNPIALALKISYAFNNPLELLESWKRVSEIIKNDRSWEKRIEELEHIYKL